MKDVSFYDGLGFEEIIYLAIHDIKPWRDAELAKQVLAGVKDPDNLRGRIVQVSKFMPEREYKILTMHYWQRLSKAEIADILGIAYSEVDHSGNNALRRLHQKSIVAMIDGDVPIRGENLPGNLARSVFRVGLPTVAANIFQEEDLLILDDVRQYLDENCDFSNLKGIGAGIELEIRGVLKDNGILLEQDGPVTLASSIKRLGLSNRVVWNLWNREGVHTVKQLVETDWENVRHLGKVSQNEIREALIKYGFLDPSLDDPEFLGPESRIAALELPSVINTALKYVPINTVGGLVNYYKRNGLTGIHGLGPVYREVLEKTLLQKGVITPEDKPI